MHSAMMITRTAKLSSDASDWTVQQTPPFCHVPETKCFDQRTGQREGARAVLQNVIEVSVTASSASACLVAHICCPRQSAPIYPTLVLSYASLCTTILLRCNDENIVDKLCIPFFFFFLLRHRSRDGCGRSPGDEDLLDRFFFFA